MDIKESLNVLKRLPQPDYSTKVLYESGLSKYQVHQLVQSGVLIRVKRGHYHLAKNGYQAIRVLEHGARVAIGQRYEEALAYFKETISLKEDENEDLTIACMINLVKLLSGLDAECDELMRKLSYQNYVDYCELFTNYKRKIIAGDIEGAMSDYYSVKAEEMSRFGHIRGTTYNIHNLSMKIYEQRMLSIYQKYVESQEDLTLEEERQYLQASAWCKRNFNRIYGRLMTSISFNDLISIRKHLDDLIDYIYPKNRDKWQMLYKLVDDAEAIKKGLLSLKKDFYSSVDSNQVFQEALENGDYLTAFELKDLVKVSKYDQQYFRALSSLIALIVRLDTKRNKKNETSKKEVSKPQTSKKEDNQGETDEIDAFQELEHLIYDKDYEKALDLCYKYGRDFENPHQRVFNNARKLIIRLLDVQKYDADFSVIDPDKQYNRGTIFSNFYAAIDNLDFKVAYDFALLCGKHNKLLHKDEQEFHIYAFILDDLVKAINEYEKVKPHLSRIKTLKVKIREMFYQSGYFTVEELEELVSLIQEKDRLIREIYGQNYEATNDMNIVQIIRVILKTKSNYGVTPDYFNTYELANASLIERFLNALYYGDYQTAFVICQSDEWAKEAKENFCKPYPRAYRKLLWQLKSQNVYHRPKTEEVTHIEVSGLDDLKKMRYFLKKRKFKEAYDYYLNHAFPDISDELNGFMRALLPYLSEYEDTLSEEGKQYQLMPKKEE